MSAQTFPLCHRGSRRLALRSATDKICNNAFLIETWPFATTARRSQQQYPTRRDPAPISGASPDGPEEAVVLERGETPRESTPASSFQARRLQPDDVARQSTGRHVARLPGRTLRAGYGECLIGCAGKNGGVEFSQSGLTLSVVKYITSAVSDASFMPVQAKSLPLVAGRNGTCVEVRKAGGALHCDRYLGNISSSQADERVSRQLVWRNFLCSAIGAAAVLKVVVPSACSTISHLSIEW